MSNVRPQENPDTICCKKHNANIILLSLEENGDNVEDRLLCLTCIEEKTKVPQCLPWKDVKTMIQEDQEKKYQEFILALKPLIQLIEDFKESTQKIRDQIDTCFENIIKSASLWIKDIQSQLSEGSTYSLFQELNTIVIKKNRIDLYSIDKTQSVSVQKCNQSYLNQLRLLFKQFYSSKEVISFTEMAQKILDFLKKNSLEKLTGEAQINSCHQVIIYQEKQEILISKCLCSRHIIPITIINLTLGIKRDMRTICLNCEMDNLKNLISISKFEERWKKYQYSLASKRETQRKEINLEIAEIKNNINLLKTQLMKDIMQLDVLLETKRKISVQSTIVGQSNKIDGLIDLQQLQIMAEELSQKESNNELQFDVRLEENTLSNNKQLILKFKGLKDHFNSIIDNVIKILESKITVVEAQKLKENVNRNPITKTITYQLVEEIQYKETCKAVAFNNQETILASSSDTDIKIWNIEKGRLKATGIILSGHMGEIYCIVFSKKINWFASSGRDFTIRCWKEIKQNNWVCSQPGKQHTQSVFCLLLNRDEDQLLSCGCDTSIKVWKVVCNRNELTYDYSLDKHTNYVECISLNESETSLVSCGYDSDKSIIIWGKGQLNKWEFRYTITKSIDDYGKRICFINDNIIAWQQYSKGITHLFELENGIYKEKPELQIVLNNVGDDGDCLFPSIFNKKRRMLIQKHNKYVYLISQQQDGKFKVESQPIDSNTEHHYGGLADNGEHLVIWNRVTEQLRLYKINYE